MGLDLQACVARRRPQCKAAASSWRAATSPPPGDAPARPPAASSGRHRDVRVGAPGRVQSAADALVDCHRLAASSGFYYMVAVDQCTYAQQASQVRATILSIRWISRSTFILARAPIISPYRHGIDRSQADILRGALVLKSKSFWVSHQQFD